MAAVAESPRLDIPFAARPWSTARRVGFQFSCVYFVLYFVPFWAPGWFQFATHVGDEWVAAHIFRINGPAAVYLAANGSGDTTLDYIHNLLILVFAAAATFAWWRLDRKRTDHRRLHAWLRIFLRYSLATVLFGYAFAKIFPLQFPPPGLFRLMEPLKDFSPMGLLWTFMGASPAYTIFAGVMEALAASLLVVRRTTTLGAVVATGVLANIVMLNLCYDVPVKLFSANLLVASIFLAAADFPRLSRVFVLDRAAPRFTLDSILFRGRPARIASVVAKTLLIGYVLVTQIWGGAQSLRRLRNSPKTPLYGIWQVDSFETNASAGDTAWKLLIIEYPQVATVESRNDSLASFRTTYDFAAHRVQFGQYLTFTFTRADDSHLMLENASISLKLSRLDPSHFLINSRGFRWISSRPFNR